MSCGSWPKTAAQDMVTYGTFVVWRDDHTQYTFFPSIVINNGSRQERNNILRMRERVQGQSAKNGFSLRPFS